MNLTGIRTILVQNGNLILAGNIKNDTTSSWAFIVENGNIDIKPEVRNLAGVYVTNRAITQSGGTTANTLTVDGSLYGNANDLIQKRTYVRGNNGYNVLTSGLIINYSSRALSNPPPLLTQYLSNFSVQRVAQ